MEFKINVSLQKKLNWHIQHYAILMMQQILGGMISIVFVSLCACFFFRLVTCWKRFQNRFVSRDIFPFLCVVLVAFSLLRKTLVYSVACSSLAEGLWFLVAPAVGTSVFLRFASSWSWSERKDSQNNYLLY